jgi:hypothetical protein
MFSIIYRFIKRIFSNRKKNNQMRVAKVNINFTRFSDDKLFRFVQWILACMTGNPHFSAVALVALIATAQSAYDDFSATLAVSLKGSEAQRVAKNAAKLTLLNAVKPLAQFLNFSFLGNRVVLATSGFELNKEVNTPYTLQALKKLLLIANENFGSVTAKAIKGAGTKYVLMEHTTGPITDASVWEACPDSGATCVISGLVSGTRIWVRCTSIGYRGQKIVSAAVSMIVP